MFPVWVIWTWLDSPTVTSPAGAVALKVIFGGENVVFVLGYINVVFVVFLVLL